MTRTANLVGDTALHLAARYGHAEVATALLAFGAPHSPRNKWELTPLIEAVRAGYNQVVSALLQYGADPTAQNGDGPIQFDFDSTLIRHQFDSICQARMPSTSPRRSRRWRGRSS